MSNAARAHAHGSPAMVLAVFDGGPGDGQEHLIEPETDTVSVVADCSWHLYERVHTERILPDGRRAVIFRWRGR